MVCDINISFGKVKPLLMRRDPLEQTQECTASEREREREMERVRKPVFAANRSGITNCGGEVEFKKEK